MKTPNDLPGEVCNILYNVYDCEGSTANVYVLAVSAATAFLLLGYACFVVVYRRRHRLDLALFHRVDRQYVPVPLTSLIYTFILASAMRAIIFLLLIFDLPQSWIARGFLNALLFCAGLSTSHLFTLGVVAHIPPTFSEPSMHESAQTRPLVYLPSTHFIYWFNIVSGAALVAISVGVGIWFGWVRDQGLRELYVLSVQLYPLPLVIGFGLHSVICAYYCVGFYRIVTEYARRPGMQSQSTQRMQESAKRFRSVFTLMLTTMLSSMLMAGVSAGIGYSITYTVWLNLLLNGNGNAVMVPAFMGAVLYTVHKSSAAVAASQKHDAPAESVWNTLARRDIHGGSVDHNKKRISSRRCQPTASTQLDTRSISTPDSSGFGLTSTRHETGEFDTLDASYNENYDDSDIDNDDHYGNTYTSTGRHSFQLSMMASLQVNTPDHPSRQQQGWQHPPVSDYQHPSPNYHYGDHVYDPVDEGKHDFEVQDELVPIEELLHACKYRVSYE